MKPNDAISSESARLAAEAAARQAARDPGYADFAKVQQAKRQRALLTKVIRKRVVDIAQVNDVSGDDVFLIFYANSATPVEEERCVVQVWLVEQRRQAVKFDEVIYRQGVFYLPNGDKFALAVQNGSYGV